MEPLRFCHKNGDNTKSTGTKRLSSWKRVYYNGVYIGKFHEKTDYLDRYVKNIFPDGAHHVETILNNVMFEGPEAGERFTEQESTDAYN